MALLRRSPLSGTRKPILACGCLVVTAVGSLVFAALHMAPPSGASPVRRVCGGDRWYVRTLQDRVKLLPAHKATLAKLHRIPRPKKIPPNRMPIERQVVTLDTSALPRFESRASGEIEVMLMDQAGHLLWAFAPHPACNSRTPGFLRAQMGLARKHIQEHGCANVRITGVLFFSTQPRQRLEEKVQLRPILGFKRQCS